MADEQIFFISTTADVPILYNPTKHLGFQLLSGVHKIWTLARNGLKRRHYDYSETYKCF